MLKVSLLLKLPRLIMCCVRDEEAERSFDLNDDHYHVDPDVLDGGGGQAWLSNSVKDILEWVGPAHH